MSGVVVVTGASSGVGRAAATAFARRGDAVGLIARGTNGLEAAAADVRAAGGRALVLPCDVTDADAVEAAAERVERELGPIDVWVNAAMAAKLGFVWDTTPDEFRRITEVCYLGFVHGTLSALKRMRPRDRGTIVQVGSAMAYRSIPLQATYCASKFAIRGFTDSLRVELLHEGSHVHVTMVQLPGLNTPQFTWVRTTLRKHPRPVPPVYQPEVAADAIVFAATHRRRELWVGGNSAAIIAANKLLPWLGDRYLARTNVEAQQQDDWPIPPDRPDYVDRPLDDDGPDRGTHGPFDDEAHGRSLELGLAKRRRWLTAGAGALAVGGGAASLLRRR